MIAQSKKVARIWHSAKCSWKSLILIKNHFLPLMMGHYHVTCVKKGYNQLRSDRVINSKVDSYVTLCQIHKTNNLAHFNYWTAAPVFWLGRDFAFRQKIIVSIMFSPTISPSTQNLICWSKHPSLNVIVHAAWYMFNFGILYLASKVIFIETYES